MPVRFALVGALALGLFTACSAEPERPDGGLPADAGPLADAGVEPDAGHGPDGGGDPDAGHEEPDGGGDPDGGHEEPDGGTVYPLPGFGEISGDCDVLDEELTSLEPAFFVNHIDFGMDPYDPEDFPKLTPGGQEIISDGNAGGSSLYSEVFSFELLARCEAASLLKTETEIIYDTQGKLTDLLVELDGLKVGVSVTRAVAFPFQNPYSVAQAKTLLEGKLSDIHVSSANVSAEDAWVKQILYVIAYGEGHAASLQEAFEQIDPAIKGDTVVMVGVSDGDDAFLY